jgi:hypothetical protein
VGANPTLHRPPKNFPIPLDIVPVMFYLSRITPHQGSDVRRCIWAGRGGKSALGHKRGGRSRTPGVAPAAYYGAVPYRRVV